MAVAKEYGHEILRLPPYHCELNPIELAWAAEKNYVACGNKDMSLDSVEKLFRKKREELSEDFWRKCVEHVKKIEENYWESDRIQDNKVEQLIIKLKPTGSSSRGGGALECNLTGRCPFLKSLHNPFRKKICILIPCFGIFRLLNKRKTTGER